MKAIFMDYSGTTVQARGPDIEEGWILCPVCGNKTRLRIREDTILINFPLFCPKCKYQALINVQNFNLTII